MDGEMMLRRLLPLLLILFAAVPAQARRPLPPPDVQRDQLTFSTSAVTDYALSPDGTRLVMAVRDAGFARLMLASVDPSGALPRVLTPEPAGYSDPAFSRDGSAIAYRADILDAKGDIFLLKPDDQNPQPRRLTGAETEDFSPSFGPDGAIWFLSRTPGSAETVLNRLRPDGEIEPILSRNDMRSASVSPDGRHVVFLSAGDEALYHYDTRTEAVRRLTPKGVRAADPTWKGNEQVLFVREGVRGAQLSSLALDSGAVTRLTVAGRGGGNPSSCSGAACDGMVFLADSGSGSNVFRLPEAGEIRLGDDAEGQMTIARRALDAVPEDFAMASLALRRVKDRFPDSREGDLAMIRLGGLLEAEGFDREAASAYAQVSEREGSLFDEARVRIAYMEAVQDVSASVQRQTALADAIDAVRKASGKPSPVADLLVASLLQRYGSGAAQLREGLRLAGRAVSSEDARPDIRAEAALLEAGLVRRFTPSAAVDSYVDVVRRFPDSVQAATAARRVLDVVENEGPPESATERLTLFAQRREGRVPYLAAAALNRVGDLLLKRDETPGARSVYRQVLTEFSDSGRPAAAARLALAELLYREARYADAVDLYEGALGPEAVEDDVYRLARQAYLEKTSAAGKDLLRRGEVRAASSLFADLIRFDDTYLPGHRGWIRAASASGELDQAVSRYREAVRTNPADPVSAYNLGLAISYRETAPALREARKLLRQSIRMGGNTRYNFLTLGYVEEALEKAYGEQGGYERALSAYEKAWFLSPQGSADRADAALNLGNVNLALGRSLAAYRFYVQRMESGEPFVSSDTELLFYRHLGMAAFRVDDPRMTVEVFRKALAMVRQRTAPLAPSKAFGKLSEAIRARALRPAMEDESLKEKALPLARRQAEIDRELVEVGQDVAGPPPSPQWYAYRDAVADLLEREAEVMRSAAAFAPDASVGAVFEHLHAQAAAALEEPLRMAEAEAELANRLALALQDAGRFAEAREAFEATLEVNRRIGAVRNYGMLTRAAAYNAFRNAGDYTGRERERLLDDSAELFRTARDLVQQHGVPKREGGGGALISIDISTSPDEAMATRASQGFSAAQEIRICETFLARIALERGRLGQAADFYAPQLAASSGAVEQGDTYEVSVLEHRAALLDNASDRPQRAFERFARSAELAIRAGSRPGAMVNFMNMAHSLSAMRGESRIDGVHRLHRLTRRAARLLERAFATEEAECRNTLAALLMGLAPRGESMQEAVLRTTMLADAGKHLLRATDRLGGMQRPDRDALSLRAAAELNRARLARMAGADPKPFFTLALEASRKGLLPRFEWRALAGLGQFDAALETLRGVPMSGLGCGAGEIVSTFAPMVGDMVNAGRTEDALNLAEELLELERVNRMGPMFHARVPDAEADILVRTAPRLLRIRSLLAQEDGEQAEARTRELLEQEREILRKVLGEDADRLPGVALLARSRTERSWLTVLTGLDEALNRAADAAVRDPGGEAAAKVAAARDSYRSAVDMALEETLFDENAGALELFLPRAAEVADVQFSPVQPLDIRMIFPDGSGGFLSFLVTADDVSVQSLASAPEWGGEDVAVAPAVGALPEGRAVALSLTHFLRAADGLKPFRRRLMTVGPRPVIPEFFESVEGNRTAAAHTLAVTAPSGVRDSAPARPGLRAMPEPVTMNEGVRLPLVAYARDGASLSSTAFAPLADGDAYAMAHLFALYGLPSMYSGPVDDYLAALPETSPEGASANGTLFGHPGLTPEQDAALARDRLRTLVTQGQENFRSGNNEAALASFADAVAIIDETPQYRSNLPAALSFAREAAYRARRYDEAARFGGRLVDILAESAPDSPRHGDALIKYGVLLAASGRYGEAVPALERGTAILSETGTLEEHAEALAQFGNVLEQSVNFPAALGKFETAAELADEAGRDMLLARQHSNMGRILDLRLDEYVRAKRQYEKALEIHQLMGDDRAAAQDMLDIGRCDRLMGSLQAAQERYAQAQELTDDPGLRARIDLERANNAWFAAKYQDAFEILAEVLGQARESGDQMLETLAVNTSGLLHWTLGDVERSLRELNEAYRLSLKLKNRTDITASILNNQGLVLREAGRLDESMSRLEKALAMDRRAGSRWGQAYALRNMARTMLEKGDPEAAWPLLEEALALTRRIGNRINEAKVLAVMGSVRLEQGSAGEAAEHFEAARAVAQEVGLPEVRWRALHGLGSVARANGELERARDLFGEAVEIIEGLRAAVSMQELRDGFSVGRTEPYEDLVRVLADLDRPREAFHVAERSRARSLVEMLGNGPRRMRDELGTQLYNSLTAFRDRIREQRALLRRSELEAEQEVYARNLALLEDRYSDLLLRARNENPELANIVEADALHLAEVSRLLDEGVSLLVYYLLDDEILCWVVRPDGFTLHRTPADRIQLGKDVLDYRRALQNLEPEDRLSRSLYDRLLGRLDIPEGTVGIVPHGVLHHLSYAGLDDGDEYFVDRHPLFRVPSASVMAYTFKRRGRNAGEVLIAADPDLGDSALELPFARREGRSVAFNFPDAILLTGSKAAKPEVLRDMGRSRIVHIAAHGEFDRENPLLSTVRLASGQGGDGDLSASEVFGVSTPADLVVLSACQTGLSAVSAGDDVTGLNRAFIFAGTHVLAASLWRVSDVASAMLMKSFYRNLETMTKSGAMRRAMLHVRQRYPHPGYWAAFTLTGDHR
ncbi:CHAT domain-containing protein [Desulfovibrio oxyclinae]|uniref:CHAT domain-containing protein n=1 Tax=Desulfovibrio oxyclinae TaxID=63560 RepID=UPI0012E9CE01|nr:CHAT domain-containing protein [Desulfovibrio oxyclinae]